MFIKQYNCTMAHNHVGMGMGMGMAIAALIKHISQIINS